MDTSPFSLSSQTALITGGGTGLGFGIATAMVASGAKVVISGRREAPLKEAVSKLGPNAAYIVHDINNTDDSQSFIDEAESIFKAPLSILVNNAGTHLKKTAIETTSEELSALLQTHTIAAHALSAAVLPGMLERKNGKILFIASMASYLSIPMVSAYTAAKCATVGLVRAFAAEYSNQGICVNAIAPGWIQSPMLDKALSGDPVRKSKILSRTPSGTFGAPSDIGSAAVFLCSPAANFITGAILPVDGGAHTGF